MDIVDFWHDQTEIWNEQEKCGFCWTFGGGITEQGISNYKVRKGEECCVHLFITNIVEQTFPTIDPLRNQWTGGFCDMSFTLWALVPSSIDINNYNEMPGHPIEGSAWAKILSPLQGCFGCEPTLDCEIIGYYPTITRWMKTAVFKKHEMNYDGWRIDVTFRKNI